MLLQEVVESSAQVASTPSRLGKIDSLAELLRGMRPAEIPAGVGFLTGRLRQGALGVGYASLRELAQPAETATLTLEDVDHTLTKLSEVGGPGSRAERQRLLDELFRRATPTEQSFLVRLLLGELRQGALEGVVMEAVGHAAGVPAAEVRRAVMLRGDLGSVAEAVISGGEPALASFRLRLLRPVQPMLAQTAESIEAALSQISPAGVEWKLDGARIQVHRSGSEVRVFTRNLADITGRVPEVVEAVLELPAAAIVLDGEAVALKKSGRPHPFQVTMRRFGTKLDVAQLRSSLPLTPFFFDCLHLDGRDLIALPAEQRLAALAASVPERLRTPRLVVVDGQAARRFFHQALKAGHEGVMVKALDAPYEAGRRGSGWLKVKPVHTLDLVVLAAEWGHGRRRGWLSNLHLGARDPVSGDFAMLGKTFKGLTDEMLEWQTGRLLELETHRAGHVVLVRPELVVEVAFDGVQASSRYPSGLALRFARVRGHRPDKPVAEADTVEAVRAIHQGEPLAEPDV